MLDKKYLYNLVEHTARISTNGVLPWLSIFLEQLFSAQDSGKLSNFNQKIISKKIVPLYLLFDVFSFPIIITGSQVFNLNPGHGTNVVSGRGG